MDKNETKYWIILASADHVQRGVNDGIAQAGHGKKGPLKRMRAGDYIIYYSGKRFYTQNEKCQKFTAIGKVKDDFIYQIEVNKDFHPYRRNIEFYQSESISILPLVEDLSFIKNKKKWGYPFRFGFFEINQDDFSLISSKMIN